jgi:hypothetical protein
MTPDQKAKWQQIKKEQPYNVALCKQYGLTDDGEMLQAILGFNFDARLTDLITEFAEHADDTSLLSYMQIMYTKIHQMNEFTKINNILEHLEEMKIRLEGDSHE